MRKGESDAGSEKNPGNFAKGDRVPKTERGQRHIHPAVFHAIRILDIRFRRACILPARGDTNVYTAMSRLSRDEMNLSGGSSSGISFLPLSLCSSSSSSSFCSLVARLSRASFFAHLREDRSALIAPCPGEGSKNEFDDGEKETLVTRSSIEGSKRKGSENSLIE